MPLLVPPDTPLPGADFEITTQTGTVLRLRGTLSKWQDDNQQRVNEHLVLNRDGAIHQSRGAGPRRFTARCLVREPDATGTYQLIESSLNASPFCTVQHPRFGTMHCVSTLISVDEDLDQTINAIWIEIQLTETGLRQIKPVTPQQSARQASKAAELLSALGSAAGLPTRTLVQLRGLVSVVSQFTALLDQAVITTVSAATGLVQDVAAVVSLQQLRGAYAQVESSVKGLIAVIGADVGSYPLTAQARLAQGQCLQAVIAAGERIPPVISYRVPARTSLARLVQGLYGGGGMGMEQLVAQSNRIPTPHAIPPGTILQVPDPDHVTLPNAAPPSAVPLYS